MAWYNKYRPYTFKETVGQELVKRVLQNTVKTNFTQNPKIKHAYLLSGPRGTGKTSLARIFARSVNCLDHKVTENEGEACGVCDVCQNGQIDIIELDAASNTGIDNIRDLIEAANTPPFISKYKVYIIDEIHMLSKSAMNALLKTLEEPPSYLVFLLATTDPDKILNTILSRVTHLKLTNHSIKDISQKLKQIAQNENLEINDAGINLIAKVANGGLRDGVNLLETISHYNLDQYSEIEVSQILGVLPDQRLDQLSQILINGDYKDLKKTIDEFESLGTDPEILLSQLLDHLLTNSLESYIEGNGLDIQTQGLIQILSQTLSAKLNTGSIQSTLILIKIQLGIDSGRSNQLSSTLVKQDDAKPIIEQKSREENKPEEKSTIKEILPNPQLESKENGIKEDNIDFYSLIENGLNNDKAAPMALKSYLNNISVVEDADAIYLFLENKSIILLLKSTKVTQWLKDLAQKNNRGTKPILIITEESQEYEKIKTKLSQISKTVLTQTKLENNAVNNQNSSEAKIKTSENNNPIPNNIDKQDEVEFQVSDFYYLQAPLPDGRVPKGMKLISSLPKTTKTVNQEPDSNAWNEALAGLDLE